MAFAITAPVAPATANPHGGITVCFDCTAMVKVRDRLLVTLERLILNVYPVAEDNENSKRLQQDRGVEVADLQKELNMNRLRKLASRHISRLKEKGTDQLYLKRPNL